MATTGTRSLVSSRTRAIAFVGLTIALIWVSAWITVPIGPIPFTLQMFAITFAIVVLTPKQALAAIAGYLLLGLVGVPVFSSMRGGIGVLAGPTGGFLWGYLFGVAAAVFLLYMVRTRTSWDIKRENRALDEKVDSDNEGRGTGVGLSPLRKFAHFMRIAGIEIAAGVLFTVISYVCGWAQYMVVAGVGPLESFVVCIAPFAVLDFIKIVVAVACARAVRTVVR